MENGSYGGHCFICFLAGGGPLVRDSEPIRLLKTSPSLHMLTKTTYSCFVNVYLTNSSTLPSSLPNSTSPALELPPHPPWVYKYKTRTYSLSETSKCYYFLNFVPSTPYLHTKYYVKIFLNLSASLIMSSNSVSMDPFVVFCCRLCVSSLSFQLKNILWRVNIKFINIQQVLELSYCIYLLNIQV